MKGFAKSGPESANPRFREGAWFGAWIIPSALKFKNMFSYVEPVFSMPLTCWTRIILIFEGTLVFGKGLPEFPTRSNSCDQAQVSIGQFKRVLKIQAFHEQVFFQFGCDFKTKVGIWCRG